MLRKTHLMQRHKIFRLTSLFTERNKHAYPLLVDQCFVLFFCSFPLKKSQLKKAKLQLIGYIEKLNY